MISHKPIKMLYTLRVREEQGSAKLGLSLRFEYFGFRGVTMVLFSLLEFTLLLAHEQLLPEKV